MELPTTRHARPPAWLLMRDATGRRPPRPPRSSVTIMVLTGDLDDHAVRWLEHAARHLPHGTRIRLDLNEVSWIGAAGMRLFQRWHADPRLTLTIAACSPQVRRTAAHANLSAMLPPAPVTVRATLTPAA